MAYTITQKCNGCGACVRVCPADAITGEKKTLHTIFATKCIECGACGRICPQASVLDATGALCDMVKRSEWPKPRLMIDSCTACGICVNTCPVGCLAMSELPRDKGADPYPWLQNTKACIGCGFCSQDCPSEAMKMGEERRKA